METTALVESAKAAKASVLAPHSHFAVEAAFECEERMVFTVCNVENLPFGLSMYAKRFGRGSARLDEHP